MNRSLSPFVFVICLSIPQNVQAQTNPEEELLQLISDRIGMQFETNDDSQIWDVFYENLRNPVNLNTATFNQLQGLVFLSDFQIIQLMEHIKKYGPLYSAYELQSIPGFDMEIIKILLLFARIEETEAKDDRWRGSVLARTGYLFQKKAGFNATDPHQKFLGPPFSTLLKIRLDYPDKYSFGMTLENDPGEPLMWKPGKMLFGTGYSSAYFEYGGDKILKKLIIGDFQASWGQGLVFGGGFSMGKGRFSTASQKHVSSGLKPYRSTSEQGNMRGFGFTIGKKSLEISTLVSGMKIDANFNENGNITSRYLSGVHRNHFEIDKKASANERSAGMNIHFSSESKNLAVGLSGLYTKFDKTFEPSSGPENNYSFKGHTNKLAGAYMEFRNRNYIIYGEGAANDKTKYGYILGILTSLSDNLETLLSIRNYRAGFTSLRSGNVFGESSSPANEKGLYLGLKFTPSKKIVLSSYADLFKSPWLTRTAFSPRSGSDYMVDFTYSPSELVEIRSFYGVERKTTNAPKESGLDQKTAEQFKKMFKIELKTNVTDKISFKAGIWYSRSILSNIINNGSLFYTGIHIKGKSTTMEFRTVLTDSKDYSTRFYLYEPDVLYAFSIPVYYGQNVHHLILLKKKITSKLSCWAKYTVTNFRDRDQIGSGIDKISGAVKSQVKFQAIYKL